MTRKPRATTERPAVDQPVRWAGREILLADGRWVAVERSVFEAWTGARRLGGSSYVGPVRPFLKKERPS